MISDQSFYLFLFSISIYVAKQLLQDNSVSDFVNDIHILTKTSQIKVHCDRDNELVKICQMNPSSLLSKYHEIHNTSIKKINIIQIHENYMYRFKDNKQHRFPDGTYEITFEIVFQDEIMV